MKNAIPSTGVARHLSRPTRVGQTRPVAHLRNAAQTTQCIRASISTSEATFRPRFPDFSTLEPMNRTRSVPRVGHLGEISGNGVVNKGLPFLAGSDEAYVSSELNLIPLLSMSVKAQTDLLAFETLVGRFAMVSFALAAGSEIFQGRSVFDNVDITLLCGYTGTVAASVLTSAEVARWIYSSKNTVHKGTKEGLRRASNFLLPPEENSLTETFIDVVLNELDLDLAIPCAPYSRTR